MDTLRDALSECWTRVTALPPDGQDAIRKDAAYLAAVAAVEADAEIRPRLGKPLMNEAGGLGSLRATDVVDGFVSRARQALGREETFATWFDQAMDTLRKGNHYAEISAKIDLLICPVPSFNIGDFTLRSAPEETPPSRSFLLERVVRIAPISGNTKPDSTAFFRKQVAATRELLSLMLLVKQEGRVSAPWLHINLRLPVASGSGNSGALAPYGGGPAALVLAGGDIEAIQALFSKLESATSHTRIALKRFGVSRAENDPDERLLHLMSAAEALFLAGEGTESAYKLALRGAFFIATDKPKRNVFRLLKAAYAVRSKVAHGDSPDKVKRIDLDGKEVGAYPFAFAVDELISKAITQALTSGIPTQSGWEDLMFGKAVDADNGATRTC